MRDCQTCGAVLTHDEKYYYETECNECVGKWSQRLSVWRNGGQDEELDKMFGDRPRELTHKEQLVFASALKRSVKIEEIH